MISRARVAADDWLARKEREVPPPPAIRLPLDGFRVFMLEAFMAGAAWSDDAFDDQRREGQRQLDDATALMTEAATLLRGYEAHHRGKIDKTLNHGSTDPAEVKAETNALMASRLEAWLRGEEFYPVKPGSMSAEGQAAQEAFVSAALDAGVDQIGEGDEPPFADRTLADCKARFHEGGFVKGPGLRAGEVPAVLSPGGRLNPIDVLREVAEGMVDGEVIKGVDHESFDRGVAWLDQPVGPITTERVRVPGVITESRQEIRYEIEGEEGLDLTQPIWINGVPFMPARQYEAADVLANAETLIREASDFIRGVTGANPGSDSEEMCQRLDAWPLSLATDAPATEEN